MREPVTFASHRWLQTRQLVLAGVFTCMMVGVPLGCSSSIEQAPLRYRQQNLNSRYLLPDVTVERLQACAEEYGSHIADDSLRVEATLFVDLEGRRHDIVVEGVPDNVPDFATCARVALQDMAVPDLPLRANSPLLATNAPDRMAGNELANPAIFVEITILLGEFAAQHGGKAILYSVSVEVLSAAAIAGAVVYLKKKKKNECQQHLNACLDTPTNDKRGNHWNEGRCLACFNLCTQTGSWPPGVPFITGFESCAY